jgi:hypothetical protein
MWMPRTPRAHRVQMGVTTGGLILTSHKPDESLLLLAFDIWHLTPDSILILILIRIDLIALGRRRGIRSGVVP